MIKNKIIPLFLLAAVASQAALIKDVRFNCDKKDCAIAFQFASEQDLPTFFQKFDASRRTLTLGFSNTDFAMGEGYYTVDGNSEWVKGMRVFKEPYKGMNFLKIEMNVGTNLLTDKNEIALNKSNFLLKLNGKDGKSWTLSKLFAEKKKEAEKAALAEKKRLAEEKKAAEKAAKEAVKAEKIRQEEERKAAAKAALEEKKRLAEEKKAAEKAALEEKKRLAAEQKNASPEAQNTQTTEQVPAEKVSALIPNVREMTVLVGSGMEQFRLIAGAPIQFSNVSAPDKAGIISIGLPGPQKSPVFKVSAGTLVKSVTWGANGLKIQLNPGVNPVILVQEGALVLQVTEAAIKNDGFLFWAARETGIYTRNWLRAPEEKTNFDAFVKKYEAEEKKILSHAQTFHLKPIIRELIVVAEEVELFAAPNENAQVLDRLLFGDRLINLDVSGLYIKVQRKEKTGYVNKRSVSYMDELTAVQAERLKQIALEKGEKLDESKIDGSQLDGLYEDRVMYSSFGRRDPFVDVKGLVEEGINIDQVELVGIIWESEVPLAILAESKDPSISYTLKEGDKILNGKVLKITQTDVLFLIQEFGVSRRYSMALPDKFGGQK